MSDEASGLVAAGGAGVRAKGAAEAKARLLAWADEVDARKSGVPLQLLAIVGGGAIAGVAYAAVNLARGTGGGRQSGCGGRGVGRMHRIARGLVRLAVAARMARAAYPVARQAWRMASVHLKAGAGAKGVAEVGRGK